MFPQATIGVQERDLAVPASAEVPLVSNPILVQNRRAVLESTEEEVFQLEELIEVESHARIKCPAVLRID